MKLGFWNRLALVVGVISVFALPTWWAVSTNLRHSQVMESGYETCLAAARERQDPAGWNHCFEVWLAPEGGYIGWAAWGHAVAWAVPAVLAVYALIWLAVQVAKWVWRGRLPRV